MTRLWPALAAASLLLVSAVDAAWRSEGPFLGAVVDVAIDPTNPDIIYAATGSAGVWRSDDGGQTWTLPGDGMVKRSVEWIEVDPGNPSTIWAAIDNTGGPGLWRSPDRGKTWGYPRPDAGVFHDRPDDRVRAFQALHRLAMGRYRDSWPFGNCLPRFVMR